MARGDAVQHSPGQDALREGGGVKTLRIRLLLTDPRAAAGLPLPIGPDVEPSTVQPALITLTDRAICKIGQAVRDIVTTGLARQAEVNVRVHRLGPIIEAYTINAERNLIGLCPVTEHAMNVDGQDFPLHTPPRGTRPPSISAASHSSLRSPSSTSLVRINLAPSAGTTNPATKLLPVPKNPPSVRVPRGTGDHDPSASRDRDSFRG